MGLRNEDPVVSRRHVLACCGEEGLDGFPTYVLGSEQDRGPKDGPRDVVEFHGIIRTEFGFVERRRKRFVSGKCVSVGPRPALPPLSVVA